MGHSSSLTTKAFHVRNIGVTASDCKHAQSTHVTVNSAHAGQLLATPNSIQIEPGYVKQHNTDMTVAHRNLDGSLRTRHSLLHPATTAMGGRRRNKSDNSSATTTTTTTKQPQQQQQQQQGQNKKQQQKGEEQKEDSGSK